MRWALFEVMLASGVVIAGEAGGARGTAAPVYRIDHVVDGDTIAVRNGQRVRLVQIDTPEVFFGTECYGRAASRATKSLLPVGSRVRLFSRSPLRTASTSMGGSCVTSFASMVR